MIKSETIEQIKQNVKITDYLRSKGFTPVNSTGRQYVYRSPLTNERSGSFFVEPERNVFNDFSSGEKGDNIRLVRLLEKLDFVSAIRTLEKIEPSGIFFDTENADILIGKTEVAQHTQAEITDIRPLQNRALVQYVESRSIPFHVAYNYVKEIHYKRKKEGKVFFGVGFQTDKGSWAIRSKNFKTWIGSGGITTLNVEGSTAINLFEGFFDFLSALTYFRVKQMRNTTIILNGNANLKAALPRLIEASTVFTYLDRDGKGNNGGLQAMQRIRDAQCRVIDRSNLYEGFKDFNERLCSL